MNKDNTKFQEVKELWEKLRSRYAEKIKPKKNLSGMEIKTVYTPDDIEGLDLVEMPGVYPYTRGLYPDGYALTPWMQQMVFGYGTVEETRAKMEQMVADGMEGYFGNKVFNLVLDIPCMYGIDSDHPEARGNVGQCGCVLCTVEDYDEILRDWDLNTTNFSLITGDNCLPALALACAAAERRKESIKILHGNSMNWYPRIAVQDVPSWEPKWGYALMGDLMKFCTTNIPAWNTTNIFMYGLSEAGATPVQELGYGLSWGKSVIDAGKAAGLSPDSFVGRLGFQIGIQNDFFEEVAKLRAHRRMWAKITRDSGCEKPQSMFARVHIHTSGNVLTAQQPLNNTARITMQVMAAIMGGVQSIHSCSFDEAISIPTEISHRTAIRTQQIMMWESGLRNVADPLGGSYYVEALTDKMEKEAWKIYNEIELKGGYMKGLEEGWIKKAIDETSYKRKKAVKSGEWPVVGMNMYKVDEETEYKQFKVDLTIEKKAIERLKAFKSKRSPEEVDKAIKHLRDTCFEFKKGKADLMMALVEAARKGVTNGEMMVPMREAFGWYVCG
jgi:methylmalonyl-CoA mutase N-terminal domain/subunit